MGTKSYSVFFDGKNRILNMYRQFDGYPSGHGLELALCLAGYEIVDGYGKANQTMANGMGCLAAFVVSRFKTETGGIYLAPMSDGGNDYTYTVKQGPKGLKITVKEYENPIFSGSLDQFIAFCEQGE